MEMLNDVASLCRFIRRLATSRRHSIGLRFRLPLLCFFCLLPTPRVNSFSGCLNVYRQPENALQRQLKRGAHNNAAHARLWREMEYLPVFAAVEVIRKRGELGGNARRQRGEVVFV